MIEDSDLMAAIGRIALSDDGVLLYRYLQRELQRITPVADAGALQVLHGRRTFAHDLMALMSEGVEVQISGGRRHDNPAADDPVVFGQRHAANVAGFRGARRRVQPDPGLKPAAEPDPDAS